MTRSIQIVGRIEVSKDVANWVSKVTDAIQSAPTDPNVPLATVEEYEPGFYLLKRGGFNRRSEYREGYLGTPGMYVFYEVTDHEVLILDAGNTGPGMARSLKAAYINTVYA